MSLSIERQVARKKIEKKMQCNVDFFEAVDRIVFFLIYYKKRETEEKKKKDPDDWRKTFIMPTE